MSIASVRAQHSEWVSALDGDGPWLTVPALTQVLDAGLIPSTTEQNQTLRRAWTTYSTAASNRTSEAQQAWIRSVVTDLLGWGDYADFTHADRWVHTDPVHEITITPGFALLPRLADDDSVVPVLLGFIYPPGTPLTKRVGDGWATTPTDRAAHALRAADVPLGVVTDGRWWTLLWAPRSKDGAAATSGYALWSTDLLLDDELLRSAFTTLLSQHRSLAVADAKTLRGLFEKSGESQEDITENLSVQTRKAVELLVDAFSTANHRVGGAYLDGVDADHVYQGAVTIVMRIIFTLAAEERRLLPGDDDFYTKTYGIAGLADRMIERGNRDGEDLLADTYTAFPQVLATSRVIHDGIHHNRLNIPGYGGSVFDPRRFPWLETAAKNPIHGPIGVDDRTMLHILRGLTRWDGRRLSYRTLDVEQIGYAYEGLLDHTAILATSPVLGLIGKKEPEATLDDIETAAARGKDHLVKWLKDLTGDSPAQINKRLVTGTPKTLDAGSHQHLVSACAGKTDLADRIEPWLPLLRTDGRTGLPIVINPGTIYVTASSARGDTGTHYTPKALAEDVVKTTLDSLLYSPGPLDTNDEKVWRLVHPDKVLNLRIADIAMGSGAFLVAAIRYLADRLLEALDVATRSSLASPALQEVWDLAHRDHIKAEWDDTRDDETVLAARALVASRSIYGVDINAMAVEMAKLSIWLVTASRNRPFSFLDHRLKSGDSLLGLHDIRQLENLHLNPGRGAEIYGGGDTKLLDFTAGIRSAITRVTELHHQIEKQRVLDTHDVDEQAAVLAEADEITGDLALVSDGIVAASLAAGKDRGKVLDARMGVVQHHAELLLSSSLTTAEKSSARTRLREQSQAWLGLDRPADAFERSPLHWPLIFPEAFGRKTSGFDAVIGNPPFLGGQKITGALGTCYREHLVADLGGGSRGSADLVAYMALQAARLVCVDSGEIGILATNTIGQGDTREVGLDQVVKSGFTIRAAVKSRRWPSRSAALEYSFVALSRGQLGEGFVPVRDGVALTRDGRGVAITTSLDIEGASSGTPYPLAANRGLAFQGAIVLGMGFTLTNEEAEALRIEDPRNQRVIQPYLNAQDVTGAPDQCASRWVINFRDWGQEQAMEYPACYARVERLVRPERERQKDAAAKNWWRFLRPRPELLAAIGNLKYVVVMPRVTKDLQPARVTTEQVFADRLVVFVDDRTEFLGVLASAIHTTWALRYGGTLETRPTYSPTDVFENFPLPLDLASIQGAAERMLEARHSAMFADPSNPVGMTAAYGRLHAEANDEATVRLRSAHLDLDQAVWAAYGFGSGDLKYGFFDSPQGTRWFLSDESRRIVLDRLLALNHERHAEEVMAGTVDESGRPLNRRADTKKAVTARAKSVDVQIGMFEVEGGDG